MIDTLKPCPFCGSANIDPAFSMQGDGKTLPGCMNCGATGPEASQETKVAAWNRRSLDAGAVREATIQENRRIQSYHRNPDVVVVLDDCVAAILALGQINAAQQPSTASTARLPLPQEGVGQGEVAPPKFDRKAYQSWYMKNVYRPRKRAEKLANGNT